MLVNTKRVTRITILKMIMMIDHIRLLFKFENDQKNVGCVGSCEYAPASVKRVLSIVL